MLQPAASFFGDSDNRVLLPYGTMQHMYPNERENAIVVTAQDGKVSDFRQITSMTFLVMAVLSSIGLVVGGFGVMNIMNS